MDQYQGDYEDQIVSCKDCGQEFVFSAGEQAFFAQKGFLAPPKRCKNCRDKKKAEGGAGGGGGMGGGGGGGGGDRGERRFRSSGPVEVQERPAQRFRRDDNGGGGGRGGRGGGGGGFDGGGGGSRTRVEVQCSQCGVMTTVPFEPAPGRPVFCRNCYQQKRGG